MVRFKAIIKIKYKDGTSEDINIVCNNERHKTSLDNIFYASIVTNQKLTIIDIEKVKHVIEPGLIKNYKIKKVKEINDGI